MSEEEFLTSLGGICAPLYPYYAILPRKRGDLFYVTYHVEGRIRRWWLRRTGWSTEWTVEYEYVPISDALPKFTASKGGIEFS